MFSTIEIDDRTLYLYWYKDSKTLKIDVGVPLANGKGYTPIDSVSIKMNKGTADNRGQKLTQFIENNNLQGSPARAIMSKISEKKIKL